LAITWIEIIDTAVKIGLGAAISGFATYRVARLNHKNNISKDIVNKKIEIIEEISELAEEYFYFCTSLNNRVGGMIRNNATNVGQTLTESQKQVIDKCHENFTDVLSKRNKALSKIQILKITDAEKAIVDYNEILGEYREIIVFNKTLLTPEQRNKFHDLFLLHRIAFYKAISSYMSSLET
jgi:hypothetical protein